MACEARVVHRVGLIALSVLWGALVAGGPAGAEPPGSAGPGGPGSAVPLVRLPFPRDDGTLTPYTFELGYPLMTLVYDTLLWRDAAGEPRPWLASSAETSPDGRTVTIELATGARWQDGQPVTSADVAFTFSYMADHPHPRFSPELDVVERVDTPDPRTAVVRLRAPAPGFADQPLADVPILPAHLWAGLPREKQAPDGLPVGSGPYRLVVHVPGQRYRLEAVDDYFRGPPRIRAVEIEIIGSAKDVVRALERHRVDMAPVSLSDDVQARVAEIPGVRVEKGPSYLGTTLMFNVRSAPFDRPEVRRAVAAAVDLDRVARVVGGAVPAERGLLHPESAFAAPGSLHAVRLADARPLLRSLRSPVTVLAPANDPVKSEAGWMVVQALRGAGAAARLELMPQADLARAVGEDGSAPTFQAAIWTTPALVSYDPAILGRLYGSGDDGAGVNLSGYRSALFDDVAQRVASTADASARHAAAAEALDLLAREVPALPLFFAPATFAVRTAVYDGWVFVKGSGILDKRSFVDAGTPPAVRRTGLAGSQQDNAGGGAGAIAVGALAVAAALGVVARAPRRR